MGSRQVRRNQKLSPRSEHVEAGNSLEKAVPLSPAPPRTLRLARGRAGDHLPIWHLLQNVFSAPSSTEFQAQHDEPLYEPTDRLLVKHADEVVAHLRLNRRTMHFGDLAVPIVNFMDLATATEYRGHGFATALLAAGERQAVTDGATIAFTRTIAADLFTRQGWSVCGRQVFSTASPRQLLAHLRPADFQILSSDDEDRLHEPLFASLLGSIPPVITVRPMRRMELPIVMQLYQESARTSFGGTVRSEVYWEWLMSRGAFDQALVAVSTAHPAFPMKSGDGIAGYAFLKDSRIVELVTAPGREDVIRQLLFHVCREALDRGSSSVRVDAAPGSPVHTLLVAAGGRSEAAEEYRGEVLMAKLLDPLGFFKQLLPLIWRRARQSDLPRPWELGIDMHRFGLLREPQADLHAEAVAQSANRKDNQSPTGERHLRLLLGRNQARLLRGAKPRRQLQLRYKDLAPLLLGHWNVLAQAQQGQLRTTSQEGLRGAETLFPELPFWRPALGLERSASRSLGTELM